MIEIRHEHTQKILLSVDAPTLRGADIHGKVLIGANLSSQDLTNANLQGATLDRANFADAILNGANLTGARLIGAKFNGALFKDADFKDALLWDTIFTRCQTLYQAKGLDAVKVGGRCVFDAETLSVNLGRLPQTFLYSVGFTFDQITALHETFQTPVQTVRYKSCFFSYARVNSDFAERLYADLIVNNVPCWIDVEDIPLGEYIGSHIDQAIQQYDRILLICSKESLRRAWVIRELTTAIEHEKRTGVKKLFPLRIDDAVFDPELEAEIKKQVNTGDVEFDFLTKLRKINIGNFCDWKNYDAYMHELKRLLAALS